MYQEILTIVGMLIVVPLVNLIDTLLIHKDITPIAICVPCLTFWVSIILSTTLYVVGCLNEWQSILIITAINWIISIKTQEI